MEKDVISKGLSESDLAGSSEFGVNDAGTCEKGDTPLTQVRSPDVHGWPYFVSDGKLIKIGFSERPRRRVLQLSRTLGVVLKTLAVVPVSIAGEFETHQRFAHLREQGEWFRPEADLLAFVRRVKRAGAKLGPLPAVAKKKRTVNPVIAQLHAQHAKRRGSGPVTSRISNIIQQMENLAVIKDPEHRAALTGLMKKQTEELARLLAA